MKDRRYFWFKSGDIRKAWHPYWGSGEGELGFNAAMIFLQTTEYF